jgi:hypothetical protein
MKTHHALVLDRLRLRFPHAQVFKEFLFFIRLNSAQIFGFSATCFPSRRTVLIAQTWPVLLLLSEKWSVMWG